MENQPSILARVSRPVNDSTDFSTVAPEDILPTFEITTDLPLIVDIMASYAEVRRNGKSVAAATNFMWVPKNSIRTRETTEAAFTREEAEQWQAWKNECNMPPLDKKRDVKDAPVSKSRSKVYRKRAAGLNVLYKSEGYTPENVAFYVDRYRAIVPLLCAATKINSAEKALQPWQTSLTSMEMVEYLTGRKVMAIAARAVQCTNEEINRETKILQRFSTSMAAHTMVMENKLKSTKPGKQDGVVGARQFLGQPVPRTTFNFQDLTSGGRDVRTKLPSTVVEDRDTKIQTNNVMDHGSPMSSGRVMSAPSEPDPMADGTIIEEEATEPQIIGRSGRKRVRASSTPRE